MGDRPTHRAETPIGLTKDAPGPPNPVVLRDHDAEAAAWWRRAAACWNGPPFGGGRDQLGLDSGAKGLLRPGTLG